MWDRRKTCTATWQQGSFPLIWAHFVNSSRVAPMYIVPRICLLSVGTVWRSLKQLFSPVQMTSELSGRLSLSITGIMVCLQGWTGSLIFISSVYSQRHLQSVGQRVLPPGWLCASHAVPQARPHPRQDHGRQVSSSKYGALNWDPDPEFWPNLDPDLGICCTGKFCEKINSLKKIRNFL